MEYIAEIKNVSKKFGDETAVREVSLSLEPGKIYGVAGRNGSGKTVLFKMIIGFLKPSSGKIFVHGKEIGKDVESMEIVGLDPDSKKKVKKYSLGMRQRLGIAQAIMENPKFLILDEPMNGLDRAGAEEIRALFLKLREEGTTILLASHHREDIEELCDEVYEMEDGRLEKSQAFH